MPHQPEQRDETHSSADPANEDHKYKLTLLHSHCKDIVCGSNSVSSPTC